MHRNHDNAQVTCRFCWVDEGEGVKRRTGIQPSTSGLVSMLLCIKLVMFS